MPEKPNVWLCKALCLLQTGDVWPHVLLTIEEYQKITATHRNMADMLECPESAEIDFEPTPLQKTLFANVDLS